MDWNSSGYHDSNPSSRYPRPLNPALPKYVAEERPRLGSLTKNDVPGSKQEKDEPALVKPSEVLDIEGVNVQLVQRCIIIQRDEKGYGLTVSGDNPVFVQSVKEDGAAARAGVQRGDRIIKVNGTLVTQSNHVEVVHLIKSGSYVALTLLSCPSRQGQHHGSVSVGAPNCAATVQQQQQQQQQQQHHSQSPTSLHHSPSIVHANMNMANRSSITGPHPVDGAMQQQLNVSRVRTMQQMLEQDMGFIENLRSEYAKHPTDKIKIELMTATQRVRQIQDKLSAAVNQSHSEPPPPPPPPRRHTHTPGLLHQSSLPNSGSPPVPPVRVESKQQSLPTSSSCDDSPTHTPSSPASQPPLSHSMDNIQKTHPWTPSGPTHSRQRSSPDAILHLTTSAKQQHNSPDLSRSHSDAASSRKTAFSRDLCSDLEGGGRRHKPSNTENNTSRASSFGAYDSASTDSPRVTPPGTPPPPYSSFFEKAHNYDHNEGDGSPQDESPISPPTRSPGDGTPGDRRSGYSDSQASESSSAEVVSPPGSKYPGVFGAQNIGQQPPIISMEEEDFLSDCEMWPSDDHGPFNSFGKLGRCPGHLSVFMHYLIANSDPSSIFFYLISVLYMEGNAKDMKKWAYEIHSTFLVPGAPLKVNNIDEGILHEIDHVLQCDLDKEEILRKVFWKARKKAADELQESLGDFRNKRSMGLGNLFGPPDCALEEAMQDKTKEIKIIEQSLLPSLESFSEDLENCKDRDSAMASALATLLFKRFGVKSAHAIALIERCPHFVSKDTKSKGIKFLKGSKKAVSTRGHHFNPQHYFNVTYCNHCQLIIWGVGNQGYQCQNCDMNIHKGCIRVIEETCIGARSANKKDKKKDQGKRLVGLVDHVIGKSRKPSHINAAAVERARRYPEEALDASSPILGGLDMSPETSSGEKAVPSGRVEKLRKTFEPLNENDDRTANNCHVVASQPSSATDGSSPADGSKKSASVVRSESLRTRGRENKQSFRKRSDPNIPRSNSDVDGDDRPVSVLNQSGSSSNSSLSTKSLDSPSNSLETVNKPTSNEISPLTSATPLTPLTPSGFASSRRDENEDSDFDVEPNLPNWADSVEWEIVRHLKPKEKKRQDVINELIYTEQTHVRNLKVLDKVFFRPMMGDQVLPLEHIKLLFPNLDEMIEIHSRLNKKLKKEKENPIVGNIGEILLEMFDGPAGENFRKAAAMFCKNQSIALESLKARQKKEQKVAQFLAEASSNPLCRRFELKDLIPTGMQRLTKYPLLLENLAKYTCATTPEHANLTKALECSKEILNHVNQAVKEAENYHRLGELQKKIDRGIFEKVDHPISAEYKHLDLTQHKMLHEGSLQWRINRQKLVDLHVLLLEDILVLLQKQDEKYVLKFHNTSIMSGREETKLTHSPIIKVNNLLTRNVAIDKRAFFLVSTSSQVGPQIYELVALSSVDQKTWLRHITEAAEAYKKDTNKKLPPLVPGRDLEVSPEDNLKPSSLDNHENQEPSDSNESGLVNLGGESGESSTDVDVDAGSPAVAVVVADAASNGHDSKHQSDTDSSSYVGAAATATTVVETSRGDGGAEAESTEGGLPTSTAISGGISPSTPLGHPPLLSGTSPSPQRRFQRVEILQIAEGPPLIEPSEVVVAEGAVLQTAEPVLAPIEKLRRKEHVIKTALAEKHDLVAEILHIPREQLEHLTDITNDADGDKDAKELVVAAMVQVTRLANLINESLTVTEEDTISAGSSDDVCFPSAGATGISPPGSVSPRMMHSPKMVRKASRMPSAPVHVLLNINAALSVHMTQLLALISEREEERVRMRKELRSSREQIHLLHDARRRTPVSQSPSHSRPNSFISMSSSASELCDASDQMYSDGDQTLLLAANVPSEIPSTLEAYNKLVYQPPFIAGGVSVPPICLVNDHPEDCGTSGLQEPTFELFVDAPTESSTDDPEPQTDFSQGGGEATVAGNEASRDNRASGAISPVRLEEGKELEEAFAVVMPSPAVFIDTNPRPQPPVKDYDESAISTTSTTASATSTTTTTTTATDYGAIF